MKALFLLAFLLGAFTSTNAVAANDTKAALAALIAKSTEYGQPKLEGFEEVNGSQIPILMFGEKKINNTFDIVDVVKKTHGGTATLFVRRDNEFIRISTNVLKADETRAIRTPLAHNKAYDAILKGETFCGEVEILSSPYDTCYAPIRDAAKKTIGVYYVGYKK